MKLFLVLIFLQNIYALSYRGYSVIWRNSNNKIVKQAIYNHEAVFTPKFKNEIEELNKLPKGYVYDLRVIHSNTIHKIMYKKREKII